MHTTHLLIICVTLLLIAISLATVFICNNYCTKKAEYIHKKELEELRLNKQTQTEKENLKKELIENLISEISNKSPELYDEIKKRMREVSDNEIKEVLKAELHQPSSRK